MVYTYKWLYTFLFFWRTLISGCTLSGVHLISGCTCLQVTKHMCSPTYKLIGDQKCVKTNPHTHTHTHTDTPHTHTHSKAHTTRALFCSVGYNRVSLVGSDNNFVAFAACRPTKSELSRTENALLCRIKLSLPLFWCED